MLRRSIQLQSTSAKFSLLQSPLFEVTLAYYNLLQIAGFSHGYYCTSSWEMPAAVLMSAYQETINDKKVGAFFYNGKVFCKYLLHKDGKIYLCSYNPSYPPIEVATNDELIVYGAVVDIVT